MALHLGLDPTARTDPTQPCAWAACITSGCQPYGPATCMECSRMSQWKPVRPQLLAMLRAAATPQQLPLLL